MSVTVVNLLHCYATSRAEDMLSEPLLTHLELSDAGQAASDGKRLALAVDLCERLNHGLVPDAVQLASDALVESIKELEFDAPLEPLIWELKW